MSKIIGIVTYHRAVNYGAVLQAYALQTALCDLGVDNEIIDYRNPKLEDIHKKRTISDCSGPKDLLRFVLFAGAFNKKLEKFRLFTEEHLRLSGPFYSKEELEYISDLYDMFIVGSDQVWNFKINEFDPVYFLDFVHDRTKKKTYAASFGLNEIPSEYIDEYSRLLSGFDSILIREAKGVEILKKQFSIESSVVLDPTMLIPPSQWLDLIGESRHKGERYVLVYGFGKSIHMEALAIKIAKKTGLKIIWMGAKLSLSSMRKYGSAGPCAFLSLLSEADYVITNSFHGTALSILFNRQFFTELLPASTGVNSRLEDILNLFELQDRRFGSVDAAVIESKINYEKVNIKLDEERRKSLDLLNGVINSYNGIVSENELN